MEEDFLQEIIKFRYKDETDPMSGKVLIYMSICTVIGSGTCICICICI